MTELKFSILGRLYQLSPHEYLGKSALLSTFATPENIFQVEQILRDLQEDRLVTSRVETEHLFQLRSSGRAAYEAEVQRRDDASLAEQRRLESLQQHAQERAEDKSERKKDRRNELLSVMIGSFLGAFFGVLLGLLADLLR